MSVCLCVHTLELVLQVVVNHLIEVLRTEFRPSTGAVFFVVLVWFDFCLFICLFMVWCFVLIFKTGLLYVPLAVVSSCFCFNK